MALTDMEQGLVPHFGNLIYILSALIINAVPIIKLEQSDSDIGTG